MAESKQQPRIVANEGGTARSRRFFGWTGAVAVLAATLLPTGAVRADPVEEKLRSKPRSNRIQVRARIARA